VRVALVCPYDLAVFGGVQQLVLDLAEQLHRVGDTVTVVGPVSEERPGVVGVGRPTTIRANESRVPVAVGPGVVGAVRRAVAGHDVAHVHEPMIPLVGWAAATAGLPSVATFHADPAPWTRRLYRWAEPAGRRILGNAVVSAVSEVAAAALPDGWGPVSIVPNAIDVGSFSARPDRRPGTVAFLGRDDPRKGLDVLLRAWPAVRAHHPGAELTVMGARRAAGSPGVRFLGPVDEETKRRELGRASVYVAPNRSGESFGIILLEAMASGCRVVASDLPAFRAVVGDQAILVPPADPAALGAALGEALHHPPDPVSSAAARAQATRFDWSAVVNRYRDLYRRAAAGATGESPVG
jgi:phosphatidyl-myo-inositol alpha-mannosyltransferase